MDWAAKQSRSAAPGVGAASVVRRYDLFLPHLLMTPLPRFR